MASVDITKSTAAQRQIDAAIRMLFSDEDALAVHTVAAAAHRIVLDLTEKRSGARGKSLYAESVREALTTLCRDLLGMSPSSAKIQRDLPRFEKFFRKHLNRPANFLKSLIHKSVTSQNQAGFHRFQGVLHQSASKKASVCPILAKRWSRSGLMDQTLSMPTEMAESLWIRTACKPTCFYWFHVAGIKNSDWP